MNQPRARHHTSSEALWKIQKDGAIHPCFWSEPAGVHVELEPFGSALPGVGGPTEQLGTDFRREGAYVEFDLPEDIIPTDIGRRVTAIIPTEEPLSLVDRQPKYVVVRRWWNLWYFWRQTNP